MQNTMVRRFVVGALAAAGLTAAGAVSTRQVQAGQNPFAGKFAGVPPGVNVTQPWSILIGNGGRIAGKVHFDFYVYLDGSFVGKVDADGRMTGSGSYVYRYPNQTPGSGAGERPFSFVAATSVNAAGDIAGTTDTGISFVWTRQ